MTHGIRKNSIPHRKQKGSSTNFGKVRKINFHKKCDRYKHDLETGQVETEIAAKCAALLENGMQDTVNKVNRHMDRGEVGKASQLVNEAYRLLYQASGFAGKKPLRD
ncbi:MAG: hypothetical protein WC717_03890 [Candidatus Micrarchaeia archaeon]